MVSEVVIVVIAISAGVIGGIWTPLSAWLGSSDPFNVKKFLHGFLTCTISGLVFAVIALNVPPSGDAISITIFWFEIFFASAGVDYSRNKIGAMIRGSGTSG